jgi:hypothetical protein
METRATEALHRPLPPSTPDVTKLAEPTVRADKKDASVEIDEMDGYDNIACTD